MLNVCGSSGCFLFGDLWSNYLRVALNFLITAMNFLSPSLIFFYLYQAETGGLTKEEYGIKLALNYGRSVGIIKPYDRVIIFEKIGDSSVVKIIECDDSER